MSNELRPGLPPLTGKLAHLPIDERGYPVPYFVAWVDGKPDHRIADPVKQVICIKQRRCWICGEPLGRYLAFLIGPMCCINRISSEPPAHRDCAVYAATACPFLTRPRMHRREAGICTGVVDPPGGFEKRNPGVIALWITTTYSLFKAAPASGGAGVLFDLGEPHLIEWWCEGRAATREEIDASVEAGYLTLLAACENDPTTPRDRALAHLARERARFDSLLDSTIGGPA